MRVGLDAINTFSNARDKNHRLIIQNDDICLVDKSTIGFWTRFKAYCGCGKASMKKVVAYIDNHRNDLFPIERQVSSKTNKKQINTVIQKYNRRRFFIKRTRKGIGEIEAETILCFGVKDWKRIGIDVKDAPPLPNDLKAIYDQDCPFWKNKRVGDTHMLVLVPKKLGKKTITIKRIGKLVAPYTPNKPACSDYRRIHKDEDGHKAIKASYWVLMTKDAIPDSLGEKCSMDHIPDGYDIPTMIEATVCVSSQFWRIRRMPWNVTAHGPGTDILFHQHQIMCQERNYQSVPCTVQGDWYGIGVYYPSADQHPHERTGIAAIKRL